jgi:hypothetical protein
MYDLRFAVEEIEREENLLQREPQPQFGESLRGARFQELGQGYAEGLVDEALVTASWAVELEGFQSASGEHGSRVISTLLDPL